MPIRNRRYAQLAAALLLCGSLAQPVSAAAPLAESTIGSAASMGEVGSVLAIIIDDLGNDYERDLRSVLLPGPVAYALLPHTPHAARLAEAAYRAGKEVILHQPMEALDRRYPGPGALYADTPETDFGGILRDNLASLPHATGVSNHMGSLLTRQPRQMEWLMRALSGGRLFFVDSRTAAGTLAHQIADSYRVPGVERDVFLDNVRDEAAITRQFQAAVAHALRFGSALAIGHPHAETIRVLEERIPALREQGITLVGVEELIGFRGKYRIAAQKVLPLPAAVASQDTAGYGPPESWPELQPNRLAKRVLLAPLSGSLFLSGLNLSAATVQWLRSAFLASR